MADTALHSLTEHLSKLRGSDYAFRFHRYAMCVALEDAGLLDVPLVSRTVSVVVQITAERGSEADLAPLRNEVDRCLDEDSSLVDSDPRLFFALHALLYVLREKLVPGDDIEHYHHTFRETVDLACGRLEP